MELCCNALFLVALCFLRVTFGQVISQSENTTAVFNTDVKLECLVQRIGPTYAWYDEETLVFAVDFEGNRTRNPGTEEKYKDFQMVLEPKTDLSLIISNVQIEYESTYSCRQTPIVTTEKRDHLTVEVPTTMVSLTCDPCDGAATPSCLCRCTASGGYPGSLFLHWTISDQLMDPQPATTPSQDGSGTFNFTSEMSVVISSNNAVLKCSVQGYVNQEELDDMYRNQVMTERELSSPNCRVDVAPTDTSAEVQLNCSCSGYPVATEFQYYVQNGTEKISVDSTYSIPCGVDTYFLCSGSNGIGFEDSTSPAVKYSCEDSTTTIRSTTTDSTTVPTLIDFTSRPTISDGDNVKGQGLETYAIILIVLACVGAAGGTGFAVYWFGFRTSDQESVKRSNNEVGISTANKEKSDKLLYESTGNNFHPPGGADNNTVTASTNETTNSAAPVYGVVNKSTKKKSDNTDGNGVNSKLQSEPDQVEYAAVNKPKSDPQPAPRSSKPPGNNTEPEKVELQYADIDHSNRGRSNEIHQPADAPTEYATVQSVIV